MAVTHDIVAKLWNLCNVLKDVGRSNFLMIYLYLRNLLERLVWIFPLMGVIAKKLR